MTRLPPAVSSYQRLRPQLKEAAEGPVMIIITITLRPRTASCERPASQREEARPASPLRRLPRDKRAARQICLDFWESQ